MIKQKHQDGVPILTYHSVQVDGNNYATNDHIGLAEDLEVISFSGWTVISLDQLVAAFIQQCMDALPHPCVAITFDDGSWFDWYDLPHPSFGPQRSFHNILLDFVAVNPQYKNAQGLATSFVIVSPQARVSLDQNCLIGKGWWSDEWWVQAQSEGLLNIQNHSWDHKHHRIEQALRFGNDYGSFENIKDFAECHWQIDQGQAYLDALLGSGSARYFAYPYGHCPDILAERYLPTHQQQTGVVAAFTTEPEPVTQASNRWRLPRYVFRRDWSSLSGLQGLLDSLQS